MEDKVRVNGIEIDKHTSLRNLISYCSRGYNTDMASVVIYQDILAYADPDDMKEIANDPKLNETFYRLYACAYGVIEAIKFYCHNSDYVLSIKEHEQELEDELDCYKADLSSEEKNTEELREVLKEQSNILRQHEQGEARLEKELADAKDEIVKLKVMLFDMMMKK